MAEDEYGPLPTDTTGSGGSRLIGGFPDDYRVTYPDGHPAKRTLGEMAERRGRNQPVRAGYVEGDEWRPRNAPASAIEQLQRDLINAGLIDPDDTVTPGRFDATTRAAYKKLLAEANGMGVADGDALAELLQNPIQHSPKTVALNQKSVSNPADLRTVFKKAIRSTLGTSAIPEDELERMIAAYQQKELGAQSDTAALVTAPPDASVFAADEAKRLEPERAGGRSVQRAAGVLSRMLGGTMPSESVGL